MTKTAALATTLKRWRTTSFSWGEDCLMSLADHLLLVHPGKDIGAAYRGRYSSESEALGLVDDAGGVTAILGAPLTALGFAQTDAPEPGDIVTARFDNGVVGGIATQRGFAFRLPGRGLVEIGRRFVTIEAAWRI